MGVLRICTATVVILAFLLVVSVQAQDARAHYATGLELMDEKQYEEAISAFQQAVEMNPSYFDALTGLGYAYTLTGRFDEAVTTYGRALAIQPNSTFTLRSLGYVYTQKGDYQEALVAFDRAVEIDPADAPAWTSRGLALSALGRFNESIASYENAIRIAPTYYYAWFSLGMEYYGAGMYSEALPAFDAALEIDERSSQAWNYRGLSLAGLGRSQEAIESFNRGLIVDPEDATLLENREAAEAQLRAYVGEGSGIPWQYVLVPIVLIGLAAGGFLILRGRKKGTVPLVLGTPPLLPLRAGEKRGIVAGRAGPLGSPTTFSSPTRHRTSPLRMPSVRTWRPVRYGAGSHPGISCPAPTIPVRSWTPSIAAGSWCWSSPHGPTTPTTWSANSPGPSPAG